MTWGTGAWGSEPWAAEEDAVGGGTTYTIIPSGGIAFAGSATYIQSKVFIPDGGFTFSGTGLDLRTKVIDIAGGVSFGGTGNMSSNTSVGAAQTGERTKVGVGT